MLPAQEKLQPLLWRDIQRSVDRFANLDAETKRFYGLSDAPVELSVGTDVESMLFQGDRLISTHKWGDNKDMDKYHPLAERFVKRCNDELGDILYTPRSTNKGVFFDQKRIEANLKPSDALDACAIFHEYDQRASAIAEEMGLRFIIGPGHWHVSLRQDGDDLLADDHKYPNFRHYAGFGITILQDHLPALFVRPRIADDDESTGCIVSDINFSQHGGSNASVLFKRKFSAHTLENRLVDGTPEQSISLTLKGLLFGIENQAEDPYTPEPSVLKDIAKGFLTGRFKKPFWDTQEIKPVQMGDHGGFLTMLDITQKSDMLRDLYDTEIANLFIVDAIERYREYLTWPVAAERFDEIERSSRDKKLLDIKQSYAPLSFVEAIEYGL